MQKLRLVLCIKVILKVHRTEIEKSSGFFFFFLVYKKANVCVCVCVGEGEGRQNSSVLWG